MSKLPRVGVILTGGTINSVAPINSISPGTSRPASVWRKANCSARSPSSARIADVREIPFRRLPSQALTTSDWLDLVRTIHAIFEKGDVDGLVITHGTNTLEETAYFLNLTLEDRQAGGSRRRHAAIERDQRRRLSQHPVSPSRVAAAPQSRGIGCLVVMNDTIFGARDVTKTATYRVNAFQARDLGPLGYADADGQRHFLPSPDEEAHGRDRVPT